MKENNWLNHFAALLVCVLGELNSRLMWKKILTNPYIQIWVIEIDGIVVEKQVNVTSWQKKKW